MKFQIQEIIISKTPSGNQKSIQVYKLNNSKTNKTIYLQAGIHGTELTGTPILFELISEIQNNPKQYSNFNYIIVPICNPESTDSQIMGLQTGYNNIHTNAQNCENFNRPNLNKKGSIEYNHIQTLFELSQDADIIIDLHTSGKESLWHLYCNASLLAKAKSFGIEHIIAWETVIGCFEDLSFQKGKETYTLECGPSRSISKSDINKGLNAINNFLNQQKQSINFKVIKEDQIQSLKAPESGFLIWNKKAGDNFKKDDLIAEIIHGVDQKTPILATNDGFILLKDNIQAVYQYQQIGECYINQ